VANILNGATPADLPIEVCARHERLFLLALVQFSFELRNYVMQKAHRHRVRGFLLHLPIPHNHLAQLNVLAAGFGHVFALHKQLARRAEDCCADIAFGPHLRIEDKTARSASQHEISDAGPKFDGALYARSGPTARTPHNRTQDLYVEPKLDSDHLQKFLISETQ
jgi:hypothetical protein